MNVPVAEAILAVAAEGGYFEDEIPKDDEELIKEAEFYLMHARAALEAEQGDEYIEKIVKLGEPQPGDGYEQEPEEEPEPEPESEPKPEPETKPARKSRAKKTRESKVPDDEPARETDLFKRENLPVPRQIEGDPPEMPFDISECSDKQIRSLASQFQACLNRAIFMMRQTMDALLRAKQLRSAAYRKAYIAEDNAASEVGRKVTKEALDIAAMESPEYKELDERVFDLEQEVSGYKALKEIYEGNVGRLSREATIRDDEYKRSGKR